MNNVQADDELSALDAANNTLSARAETELDRLKQVKDREMEIVQNRHKAEQDSFRRMEQGKERALQRRQELEDRALQRQKKRDQEAAQSAINAADKRFAKEQANLTKRQASERAAFERSIAEIKKFTGLEGQVLDEYLKKALGKFSNFGYNVRQNGKVWSQIFGSDLVREVSEAGRAIRDNEDLFKGMGTKNAKYWIEGTSSVIGLTPKELQKYSKKHWSTGYQGGQVRHEGGPIGSGGNNSRRGYPNGAAPFSSEKYVLAEDGEYMVDKKTVEKYGTGFFDNLRKTGKDDIGTGGSSNGLPNAGIMNMVGGALVPSVDAMLAAMSESAANTSSNTPGQKGTGPVALPGTMFSKNGWQRPWNGHYSANPNGHDFNVPFGTALYAPHDGYASGYDIRGYEPRRARYGLPQDGFRSYGRVLNFSGGGAKILMGHLSQRFVKGRTPVKKGDLLGYSGGAGNASGPHIHAEVNGQYGGLAEWFNKVGVPLNTGGTVKYDNVPAFLHKKEKVLTAPLSDALERGINKLDQGTNNEYNSVVNINVGTIDSQERLDELVKKVDEHQRHDSSRYTRRNRGSNNK